MSEFPSYPDQCEHGASRPEVCGHCQTAALKARIAMLETELRAARDVLRASAPQSWAAGTNLYESALSWERDAVACIARIATIVSE